MSATLGVLAHCDILVPTLLSDAITETISTSTQMGQNMCWLPKQLHSVWSCRSVPEQLWSTLGEGEKEVTWIAVASNLHIQMNDIQINHGDFKYMKRLSHPSLVDAWCLWQAEF